jgi:vacuolar iron transporter family protein
VGGNALRAAVLGANDGLCSNLSLVMGVAGASVDRHGILVTGVAGLLAGACSMALGEWGSVTSARELAQREIRIESSELAENPEAEGEELKLIHEAKGLSPSEAETLVRHLLADRTTALEALTREELGIDPNELGGSAWEAAHRLELQGPSLRDPKVRTQRNPTDPARVESPRRPTKANPPRKEAT